MIADFTIPLEQANNIRVVSGFGLDIQIFVEKIDQEDDRHIVTIFWNHFDQELDQVESRIVSNDGVYTFRTSIDEKKNMVMTLFTYKDGSAGFDLETESAR